MYMFFRQRPNKCDSAVPPPFREGSEGMCPLHPVRLQAYEPDPRHSSYPVYL